MRIVVYVKKGTIRKTKRFWRRLRNFVRRLITATAALALILSFGIDYQTPMDALTGLALLIAGAGWIALFMAYNPQYFEQKEKEPAPAMLPEPPVPAEIAA